MKQKGLVLLIIFVITFNAFISAATIADISTDHWAYQSVNTLVDKGLLELYEDGTFRGSDYVSRNQLAVIVARILEEIEGGSVKTSDNDMDLLRKLSVEFQEELVDLAISGEVFEDRFKALEQKNLIQDEFMMELKDVEVSSLKNQIGDLNERISNAESDVTNIIDSILKIRQIEEKLDNIEKVNNEHNLLLMENKKQIEELSIEITDETIQSLQDRISINSTRLNSLQDQMSSMESELEAKDIRIDELENENSNYKNYLYGVAGVSLILLLISN